MRQRPVRPCGLLLCGLVLVVILSGACGRKTVVGETDIARITPEEVKARLDKGEAITFVDSRSAGAWAGAVAKIPGAMRVPPHEAADYVSEIPRGNPVVIYCT